MTETETTNRTEQCPICGRPRDPKYRPFCSSRCAEVDLGRWLTDQYRVPGEAAKEEEA